MNATVNQVLKNTTRIVNSQKRLAKARGEDFNVFSVLNMERKENRTHSAFIKALLDPKGKHYQGEKFLKLFLEVIKVGNNHFVTSNKSLNSFETRDAKIILEKYIGRKKINKRESNHSKFENPKQQGGRIDIFLQDKKGNTICIENKIDATDQEAQIKRYYNYNTANNCVLYLNKFGDAPDKKSSLELEQKKDYLIISYNDHIIKWLDLCLKESVSLPILRENIRQYILLIKKITHTVTNQEKQELKQEMFSKSNIEASKTIASNYFRLENEIKEDFRKAVYDKLISLRELNDFDIDIDKNRPASKTYSVIWLKFKKNNKNKFYGIESFSGTGHSNGNMFIGILDADNKKNKIPNLVFAKLQDDKLMKVSNSWWPLAYKIDYKNEIINLSDKNILSLIANKNSAEFNKVVDVVVKRTLEFIEDTKPEFLEFLNNIETQ